MSERQKSHARRSGAGGTLWSIGLLGVVGCQDDPHLRMRAPDAAAPPIEVADAGSDIEDAAEVVDAQEVVDAAEPNDASEPLPQARFVEESRAVAEADGRITVEVALDTAALSEVTITLDVSGSLNEGVDCAAIERTLHIAPGERSAFVTVMLTNDDGGEETETLVVALRSATGAEVAEPSRFTLSVTDDDERAWPGASEVVSRDQADRFGTNMSGITYQPALGATPAVLWLVQNAPSVMYKMVRSGAEIVPVTDDQWGMGKVLHFPSGHGEPDAEGVTKALWNEAGIYVASERDGAGESAPTILRFDSAQPGAELTATHAWDLTGDLPVVSANLGIEAVSWLPDAYLVAHGFFDEHRAALYDPTRYPNHGLGLFVAGLEANGSLYVYALDHTGGGAIRVATIESGQPAAMGLEFDRDSGLLWAHCDDTCGNTDALLRIDETGGSSTRGRFRPVAYVTPPVGLVAGNHEGFALAPDSECVGGLKSAFWLEDGPSDGHTLREGRVDCVLSLAAQP